MMSVPDVNCIIDTAPPEQRAALMRTHVTSQGAVKTCAEFSCGEFPGRAFFGSTLRRDK